MSRWPGPYFLLLALLPFVGDCTMHEIATADKDTALATRIEQLVETFLTSDDEAKSASVLSDARLIFEREGIPSPARVGDGAACGGTPPANGR